jgi:hypothetical protein
LEFTLSSLAAASDE